MTPNGQTQALDNFIIEFNYDLMQEFLKKKGLEKEFRKFASRKKSSFHHRSLKAR